MSVLEGDGDIGDMALVEAELDKSYARAFNSESEVMDDLRDFCGVDQDPFNSDGRREAYLLGRLSVVRYIDSRIGGVISKQARELAKQLEGM